MSLSEVDTAELTALEQKIAELEQERAKCQAVIERLKLSIAQELEVHRYHQTTLENKRTLDIRLEEKTALDNRLAGLEAERERLQAIVAKQHANELFADTVAELVVAKLEEREKKDATIVISTATETEVKSLFKRVDVNIVTGTVPIKTEDHATRFDAFPWRGRSKEDGLADARTHIEDQMRRFGAPLGMDGYKIKDVHTHEGLLDVDDDKIGVIRGGSDIAIVPFETADFGIFVD